MKEPRHHRRALVIRAVAWRSFFVLLAAGIGVVALIGHSRDGDGFDAARWRQTRAAGCTADNPRLGLYSELRSVLLRERPVEADVVTMLGQPDARLRPGVISYILGRNVIDCDTVVIHFGPDGRVADAQYLQG